MLVEFHGEFCLMIFELTFPCREIIELAIYSNVSKINPFKYTENAYFCVMLAFLDIYIAKHQLRFLHYAFLAQMSRARSSLMPEVVAGSETNKFRLYNGCDFNVRAHHT